LKHCRAAGNDDVAKDCHPMRLEGSRSRMRTLPASGRFCPHLSSISPNAPISAGESGIQARLSRRPITSNMSSGGEPARGGTVVHGLDDEEAATGGWSAMRLIQSYLAPDTEMERCAAPNRLPLRTSEVADLMRLVRASMRLRPDAIIVGEVRGREAAPLDFPAIRTAAAGSSTTRMRGNPPGTLRMRRHWT
jgi:hypothetical protein